MVKRFFSQDSFWNKPIGKNPEVDPKSGSMLELLEKNSGGGDRGFWLNINEWTIPVYEVDDKTPMHPVLECTDNRHHGKCFENTVPIPDYAKPDPLGDAHLAVVDWGKMKAWDMFYVIKDENGQWKSKTGMTYALDGDGVFDPDELGIKNGDSAHIYGPSRAAAVPAIAGLVMYDEVMAGKIEHKLSFATCANAYQEFTYPARWTDGRFPGGIPEGSVIQLDPDLDLSKFNLSSAALIIARALQEYGAVNVDNSGGKTVYVQGLYNHPEKSWEGILKESDLTSIGMSNYRILKPKEIIKMGDARNKGKLIL